MRIVFNVTDEMRTALLDLLAQRAERALRGQPSTTGDLDDLARAVLNVAIRDLNRPAVLRALSTQTVPLKIVAGSVTVEPS